MNTPIKREDIRKGDLVRRTTEYRAAVDFKVDCGDEGAYELIERPVTLPTAPGHYLDKQGDMWRLDREWYCLESDGLAAENFAPFTLLRPVAEVAAEFAADLLAFFERPGGGLTTHENDVRLLAAEWADK